MAEPQIEFIDDRERAYFAQSMLGEHVRSFINSEVGRYLHGCARMELEEIRDELERFSANTGFWFLRPLQKRRLKKLQMRATCARHFMQWCAEAIHNGEHAYKQLEQLEDRR